MPDPENVSVRDLAIGFALGLGAAALLPAVAPALRTRGRPMAKSLLKSAVRALDEGQVKLAELRESFDDLLAEVGHELENAHAGVGEAADAHGAAGEETA